MPERSEEQPINILIEDGPASRGGGIVGIKDDQGKDISIGTWEEREDGLWALRITSLRRDKEIER